MIENLIKGIMKKIGGKMKNVKMHVTINMLIEGMQKEDDLGHPH